MRTPRLRAALAATTLLAGTVTGCSSDDETLTVLAAASLTDVFAELATRFEADHPGVRVRLALGSSTTLARQVAEGAPGDVLATADPEAMDIAEHAGAVRTPVTVTRNALVLVTPTGNPAGVGSVADLDRVDYAACLPSAPCGAAARPLLDRYAVASPPASSELDVRGVLARVRAGEVDAGLVYRSDALAAGEEVEVVAVDRAPVTRYEAAVLVDGGSALAESWLALVRGPIGQDTLAAAGFLPMEAGR